MAQYDPPTGYYAAAEGLTGPALKAALHDIIDDHTIIAANGGDSFQALRTLDQDPANTNNVLTVYSGMSEPKFADGGLTWNREHCWPRSYGLSATGDDGAADESDLFNLRACLTDVNQIRGDRVYDEADPAHPNDPAVAPPGAPECLYDADRGQGEIWTPRPSEKGDLARAMFYMAVRYDGSDAGTLDLELGDEANASRAVFGNLTTLLQWHLDDPVSTEERRRNDLIHDRYQGNRNPFVDRPEFVAKIFGAPGLQLALERSAHDEGTSATATVSIPAATSAPLSIRIIATGDGTEVAAPSVVTIPAGQTSGQFTVDFPADSSADGDQQSGLAAWAEGYASTFFALAVLDVDGGSAVPPPALAGAGHYAQNFDALPSAGTNPWNNNVTLAGWSAQRTGTGTTIVADAGSSTGGNLYSYGSTNATDRALGSLGSANAAAGSFAHGLNLQNTSGRPVTLAALAYTGEQWRNSGATNVQTIAFSYRTGSNAVTELAPTGSTGWTSVAALGFASPVTGGTASALNGNLAANRTVVQSALDVILAPGEWITLRWQDPDHTGSDHGLAIDDVRLDWRVNAGGVLPQWTAPAPPGGRVGEAYVYTLAAEADPLHYEVEGLPPGLVVHAATGLVSGVPSAAGAFRATAYAVNAAGAERTTLTFNIAKILPVIVTPPTTAPLAPGQPLSAALLTGGAASVPGAFAFAAPSTVPPSGLSLQNVIFTPVDAASYDTVTFTIAVSVDYGSGFEDLTKTGYATGNLAIGGLDWEFTEALIGTDTSDFKNGSRSVRLRGYGTSALTMLADLSGGIGSITFDHGRYATDLQIPWVVEYSTNQGASWTEAGRFTPGETVAMFRATPNVAAPARLRIRAAIATGTSNRRANIDDLVITSYTAPAGMTFGQWSGGLPATPALLQHYAIGGAANVQTFGEAPSIGYEGAMLSIEALVRTNDPSLRVYAQATTDLPGAAWTTNNITTTEITKEPGDPADTARKIFSIPRGSDPAQFLRLRIELDP